MPLNKLYIGSLSKDVLFNRVAPLLNIILNLRHNNENRILLLGSNRSGSTWVGRTIGYSPGALYYNEPAYMQGDRTVDYYARAGEEHPQLEKLWDPAFRGLLLPGMFWHRSLKKIIRRLTGNYRIIVKEVEYLFCAGWMSERYKPRTLILVRHPCAVAASYQALGWKADVSQYLKNTGLVERHLEAFMPLLEKASSESEQIGALWSIRYRVLADMFEHHPEWLWIRYEDLCSDPVGNFRALFEELELEWTAQTEEAIVKSTTRPATKEDRLNTWHTTRVSNLQPDRWRKLLSDRQIEQVKRFSMPFKLPWYQSPSDW